MWAALSAASSLADKQRRHKASKLALALAKLALGNEQRRHNAAKQAAALAELALAKDWLPPPSLRAQSSWRGPTLPTSSNCGGAFNANKPTEPVGESNYTLRDTVTCPSFDGILYSLPPTLYLW
jgi:hypothetical protein